MDREKLANKMKTITIDDEQVKIETRPGDARKSLDIEFKSGRIIIRIPRGQEIDLNTLIKEKEDLFTRKYREAKAKIRILADGAIHINGTPRKIQIKTTENPQDPRVTLTPDTLTLHVKPYEGPARILKRWVIKETEQLIQKTLEKHKETLESLPEITRVADTSRWGYCNKKGRIIYNWQLTTLPQKLAEYIIIHEAVHLTHFHHQKGFHHKLEKILPDHTKHEKQLQKYIAIPPNFENKAEPFNP
ncbi:MAG: M48 family metallopeptidase [Candidatus Bathyarchaeota archaeon]|nr:M48 family metallopeptidase [Candidatus Bathyarchaeota archaeon]